MSVYSQAVEQRFRAPRWAATDAAPVNGHLLTGRADTPGSSAVLELRLVLAAESIRQATFLAYGCPSCIAAADWACEWLSGRDVATARQLHAGQIETALELAASKRHCGLLVEDALHDALAGQQTTELHPRQVI